MTSDPVIRWAAGAVLVTTYVAALIVAVHGYLTDTSYSPPPLIVGILGNAIGGALALLGVHLGGAQTVTGAATVTQLVKETANGQGVAASKVEVA